MDDLITWLLAQIDEDERQAQDCIAEIGSWREGDQIAADRYLPGQPPETPEYEDRDAFPSYPWGVDDRELAFMAGPGHPDRVLAECEAKRKLIELHKPSWSDGKPEYDVHDEQTTSGAWVEVQNSEPNPPYWCLVCQEFSPCPTLWAYVDLYVKLGRPGYQESWRVE